MKPSLARLVACQFLLLGADLAPGADAPARGPLPAKSSKSFTHNAAAYSALSADLSVFSRYASEAIQTAASEIRDQSSERSVRSAASGWADRMIGLYDDALDNRDPVAALTNAWAASLQIEEFLTRGEGRVLFGEQQPIAATASHEILLQASSIAADYFPPESLQEVEKQVREFAEANPLPQKISLFARVFNINKNLFAVVDKGKQTLGAIASVPLLPTRAVAGFQRGSRNLNDFTQTAERFTDVVEKLPEQTRLQLEELLTRMDDTETTMRAALADLRVITENTRESVLHADSLTSHLDLAIGSARETAPAFKDAADAIGAASREGTSLADSISKLVDQLNKEAPGSAPGAEPSDQPAFDPKEYASAAKALQDSAAEARELIEEIRKLIEETDKDDSTGGKKGDSPDHRFDIREYEQAARSLQAGATQIRGILTDMKTVGEDKEFAERLRKLKEETDDSLDRSAALAKGVTDHAAFRAAQLLGLAFALCVAWLLLRRRLSHKAG